MDSNIIYRRILLKISGESLSGPGSMGFDAAEIDKITDEIALIADLGCQIGLVVGGGNLVRGGSLSDKINIARATADQMGMVATVINALILRDVLIAKKLSVVVMSAFAVGNVCEPFMRVKALEYLEQGKVIVFAAGTGNPFCTTDTCASLRASEIGAELIIKATKVDGVYSDDPVKNPRAKLFDKLTFSEVLEKDLKVMDHSAITMCRDNAIDIVVCNMMVSGNMAKVVQGHTIGTLVTGKQ